MIPALTQRVAMLEARLASMQADLDDEQRRLATYSESDRSLDEAVADGYRGADAILQRAGGEADELLRRALDERRMLVNEVQRLREEREDLQDEIASLRRGEFVAVPQPIEVEAPPAFDLQTAIAEEMRVLLVEILADFRARAAAPAPAVDHISVEPQVAAHGVREVPEPILGEVFVDVETAPLPPDAVTEAAPIETFESIVEDVDELVRPVSIGPIVDEYVDELRVVEPIAPTDALAVEAAPTESAPPIEEDVFEPLEPAAPTVDDYVDELRAPEPIPPTDALEVDAVLPEPAAPIVDEHVFEPVEPPAAPIVDEYVEKLHQPEAPSWSETMELSAPPTEPIESIVDEYVEELPRPEAPSPIEKVELSAPPAEPIESIVAEPVEELSELIEPIVDAYLAPAEPVIDVTITPPPLPPAPDARIDALWDAASSPTKDTESAPLSAVEPASFMTAEFVADTRPLETAEAPSDASADPAPEPSIDFAPQPPTDFSSAPPIDFAPEVAIREPTARSDPQAAEPQSTFPPAFPELRIADERGLREIQVVISPLHSFPRLLETERRIRALSTVNALHLRDFRNGVATLTVSVGEAISPEEFGAVIQMLDDLHLRLEGTTLSSVELRAEDEPTTS